MLERLIKTPECGLDEKTQKPNHACTKSLNDAIGVFVTEEIELEIAQKYFKDQNSVLFCCDARDCQYKMREISQLSAICKYKTTN